MKAPDQIRIFKALSKENAAKILVSIAQNKARSPSQLAVEFKLQPIQVHRVLNELDEAGLIVRSAGNPTPLRSWVFYRPTLKGKEAAQLLVSEKY